MDKIERYIETLMNDSTPDYPAWNIEKKRLGIKSKWNYIDGCMIKAILEMYAITSEDKYLKFADDFIDAKVFEDGSIDGYDIEEKNIDNVNAGKTLFELYAITGKEKYRKAIDLIYSQIKYMPRTDEGSFWHKDIYPGQVWLDGLYMAQPFYMEYESRYNNKANYQDIFDQFARVKKYMKDERTGLYYHAYDSTKKMFWADKVTGLSCHFWLRALGWFSMALLDTMTACEDKESDGYKLLNEMFIDLMDSMLKYQDESGMWYQVVNLGGMDRNYLETSGSSIMAYALLKGVRTGVLDKSYEEYGVKAFNGVTNRYLTESDGTLHLGGICLVAGLGGSTKRPGTYDYYMSEPIVEDDAKGVGPYLLAYTEMKRAKHI